MDVDGTADCSFVFQDNGGWDIVTQLVGVTGVGLQAGGSSNGVIGLQDTTGPELVGVEFYMDSLVLSYSESVNLDSSVGVTKTSIKINGSGDAIVSMSPTHPPTAATLKSPSIHPLKPQTGCSLPSGTMF